MKIELKEELKKSIQKEVSKLMAEEISKEDSFQQMKKEMMAELFKVESSADVPAEPKKPERPRTLNSRLGWNPINKKEENVKKAMGILYNLDDIQRGFTGDEMTKEEEKFMFDSPVTKKGTILELEQKMKELESQLKNYENENYSLEDEFKKATSVKTDPLNPKIKYKYDDCFLGKRMDSEILDMPVMPKPINRIQLEGFEPFDFSTAKEKLQDFRNKIYGTSLDPAMKGLEDLKNKLNEDHSKSEYSNIYLNNLDEINSGITSQFITGATIDQHTERVLPPSACTYVVSFYESGTTESPSGSIEKPRRKRRKVMKKEIKKKPSKRLKTAHGKKKPTSKLKTASNKRKKK